MFILFGINNVNYKHVYYVAEANKYIDLKINQSNKNQILEVTGPYDKEHCSFLALTNSGNKISSTFSAPLFRKSS